VVTEELTCAQLETKRLVTEELTCAQLETKRLIQATIRRSVVLSFNSRVQLTAKFGMFLLDAGESANQAGSISIWIGSQFN